MSQSINTPDARQVAERLLGRLIGGDPDAEADVLRAVEPRSVEPRLVELVEHHGGHLGRAQARETGSVSHQTTSAPSSAAASQVETAEPSVGLLVAGGVLAADFDLLDRAARLAISARERQLVVLARAQLSGPSELFDDLIRDHLATYPDHLLAAWLAGRQYRRHDSKGPR